MKAKIIAILVMALLIAAAVLPVAGSINEMINSKSKAKTSNPLDRGWYWKPPYPNYAPNTPGGMPDFDMKQKEWSYMFDGGNGTADSTAVGDDVQIVDPGQPIDPEINPFGIVVLPGLNCVLETTPAGDDFATYTFDGVIAVANCLWWFDSKFGEPDGILGDGEDEFPLVEDYGAGDDHAIANVPLFIEKLANMMNHTTSIEIGYDGVENWFVDAGLENVFEVNFYEYPTFEFVEAEIERSQDVILRIDFLNKIGNDCVVVGLHFVTCAGVNSEELMIAFSDPYLNEDNPLGDPTAYNDAQNVSHDIWDVAVGSPCPDIPCEWWLPDFAPNFDYAVVSLAGVICPINEKPEAPGIDGLTSGKAGESYEYTFNAVDPDSDDVKYFIDWGDGNTEWTDFHASGTDVKVKHTWDNRGIYNITAKAKDTNYLTGPKAILTVTMPKNKILHNPLFLWLLEQFPFLERLLNLL